MSFTVFLGNIPAWVTADDIKSWLTAENLVSDSVKVIRHPETQESKGFAFIDAPNAEEMNSIIRRFDRAPLEDRLLRANPAQPPKSKQLATNGTAISIPVPVPPANPVTVARPPQQQPTQLDRNRRAGKKHKRPAREGNGGPQSAFAEELAKAL